MTSSAVRFVTSFPMTVTGKVRKVELREQMAAAIAQQDESIY